MSINKNSLDKYTILTFGWMPENHSTGWAYMILMHFRSIWCQVNNYILTAVWALYNCHPEIVILISYYLQST